MRTYLAGLIFFMSGASASAQVTLLKTPDRGIQPQVVVDGKGGVHLLYFKGDAKGGDLYYARRDSGKQDFAAAIKVNSQPGSAVATGTIRGGNLALGKNQRAHVSWNASFFTHKASQMYHARLNDAGTAFENQQNLMTGTDVLDGGGTVAADQAGNVFVAWHALQTGSAKGEINRKVWLAKSNDEGKTFAKEVNANSDPTGACGCCGMKGFVDGKGGIYFIYRGATKNGGQRDMFLISSADAGKSFRSNRVHAWEINTCPMSSATFAEGPGGLYVAWDTDEQVYFARIKPGSAATEEPVAAPGSGKKRKHPALAVNGKGEVLLAWTEGTGWQKGGDLNWQVFDRKGQPTSERGRRQNAVPVWGLPSAFADADGQFTIVH
jgi:hypothetical protein